jgi:hypothetical protein
MCIALFSSFSSSAQNFTKWYEQTGSYSFTLNDAVVMEKFRPTNLYPIIGTVVFQPVTNSLGINDLQVNILDDLGNLQTSRIYQIDVTNSFLSQEFVPIAASYNDMTQEYCVAGVVQTGSLCDYSSWVGIFDQNLSLIDFQLMDIQTTTFGPANLNSCMVTDICPVYDNPNGADFAFTGVLTDGGDNPAPAKSTGGSAVITDKRIFLAELETSTLTFSSAIELEFQSFVGLVDKEYFPSRIIEIPDLNNSGGYLIGGNTSHITGSNQPYDLSLFYLRLDYNSNVLDIQQREHDNTAVPHPINFFIGDLKYDDGHDEVLVSGSYRHFESEDYGFFADKLIDVTANNNIVLYSDFWNGTQQMGLLEIPSIPLIGWTKVGRMSNHPIDEHHIITASVLENSSASTNQTMKLPILYRINYTDWNFDNWTTAQDPNVFWYKRWSSTNGPVHYYTGYDYTSQWYPNHYSFPRDESQPVQSFVHGTYCTNTTGDHLTVTQTDNYSQNFCSENSTEGTLLLIPLISNGYSTNVNAVSITQSQIIVIDFATNQIDEYECDAQNPFKYVQQDLQIQQIGDRIKVLGLETEAAYSIYSLSGSKLQSGQVLPFDYLSLNNLSAGMYLLQINDEVIKVVK